MHSAQQKSLQIADITHISDYCVILIWQHCQAHILNIVEIILFLTDISITNLEY